MAVLKLKVFEKIENSVACGGNVNYTGGESYPAEYNVILGSSTGTVEIRCHAYSVPDKFVFNLDGLEVVNTGYIGSDASQTDLDNALGNLGEPQETIVPNSTTEQIFTINKTVVGNQVLNVKVYAPLDGTAWDFYVGCPQGF